MKYIASCSFGKDSLAMVLKLIEKGEPLDEVIFYDTGKEFMAIYHVIEDFLKKFSKLGIKFTILEPKMSFDYKMFSKPVCKKGTKIIHKYGYSWCGGPCRWGTTDKLSTMDKYCNKNTDYVGIAIDEPKRLEKERKPNKRFPLAEWRITKKQALEYCYSKGINWLEKTDSIYEVPLFIDLYKILDRVSCWCCRNKNLKELKAIYYYFTNSYWKQLKEIEIKLNQPMKKTIWLHELEKRFASEIALGEGKL